MADRDYKEEYRKYQSSTKAKKYRAELNKYNRQKGTYGNGDGKDASHKGGKISGFESESKNRGRREKSRKKGSKRKTNESREQLLEKLRLYLKNLGGAYSKLVPNSNSAEEERKLKADFKRMMNKFYKDHKMAVELMEKIKKDA